MISSHLGIAFVLICSILSTFSELFTGPLDCKQNFSPLWNILVLQCYLIIFFRQKTFSPSLYVALAGLKHAVLTRPTSNSQRPACLCLPNAKIKGMCATTPGQDKLFFMVFVCGHNVGK